jgi:transcriptional regulator with XRE-family HTH domain
LSQDALAQKAGISKSFLSDLDRGTRNVGAETLLDLGRAVVLSLDLLMTGRESGDPRPQVPIPAALAALADEEGLSFRQALTLLHMQEQAIANRKAPRRKALEQVDWQEFYRAVKKFI